MEDEELTGDVDEEDAEEQGESLASRDREDQSDTGEGEEPQGDASGSEQEDDAEAGEEADETAIEKTAAGEEEQDDEFPGDKEQEGQDRLSERVDEASDPRDFDPTKGGLDMSAIEEVDQMVEQMEAGEQQGEEAGVPTGSSGSSPMMLMEQLLDQIEGNPAYLMRNQFMLEEQRLMSKRRGQLYEPRPW